MEKYLAEQQDTSMQVLSAGTRAYPQTPYSYTTNKLKALGVEDFDHHQTKLSQDIVDNADIIICMTNAHKQYVETHFGTHAYLLNEIVHGTHNDLEDDDEVSGYSTLKAFVELTVQKINDAIPAIYEYVKKY
jgi:protein-tyrosine-phosphatase